MKQSSLIRQIFEIGIRLIAGRSAENIFDFSRGNPNLPPSPLIRSERLAFFDTKRDELPVHQTVSIF